MKLLLFIVVATVCVVAVCRFIIFPMARGVMKELQRRREHKYRVAAIEQSKDLATLISYDEDVKKEVLNTLKN